MGRSENRNGADQILVKLNLILAYNNYVRIKLKRSTHYETYPSSVSDVTERLLEGLEEAEFFEKEGADYEVTFKRFADFFLTRWVNGEDMEDFPEEEFSDILNRSIIESDIKRLSDRKLLDCIEDERGETLYFVTEEGKKEMERLKSK